MKLFSRTLFISTTLYAIFLNKVYAGWGKTAEIPIYPRNLSDVTQMTAREIKRLNIQSNFSYSSSIELQNTDCVTAAFPANSTSIKVMFKTADILPRWNQFWAGLSLYLYCDAKYNAKDQVKYFAFSGKSLDPQKEYTLATIDAPDCGTNKKNNPIRLKSLEISYFTNTILNWKSSGVKSISPDPKSASCSWINNFKTIFVREIPIA